MAQAFLSSDGDIATVLRTMFESPEFWSPEVYRAKIKTPIEFVVSAARSTKADVINPLPMVRELEKLGMPLYGMQTPNGYSWLAEPWVSSGALVGRMNFAVALSFNRVGATYVDWGSLLGLRGQQGTVQSVSMTNSPDPSSKEMRLELLLLGQPASEQTRAAVIKELEQQPNRLQAEREFSIQPREVEPMQAVLNAATPAGIPQVPLDREAAVMAGLLLGSPEFQRR